MPTMDLPAGPPLPGEPLKSSLNSAESLRGVGMLDLLECDPRPTFVLDATLVNGRCESKINPVYWNVAMATIHSGRLLQAFKGVAFSHFSHGIDRRHDRPFLYRGFSWTKILVAGRWDVISGTSIDSSVRNQSADVEGLALAKKTSRPMIPTFDWTYELPPVRISHHVAWARSIDWENTPLGPMTSWSVQLRSVANLIMQDPRPAVGFWGTDLIMIYNEAYVELLRGLHPCMGDSARIVLGDVWYDYFEPIIAQNLLGETVEKTNTAVDLVRNGFIEETYFSLKFLPILDSAGATAGHYEPLIETTREVISQRQSQTLLELSEELPQARNTDAYWTLATKVLSRNDKDISFGLLYSADTDPDESASSRTRASAYDHQCTLRGSFGLPEGSLAGPNHFDIREDCGFTPYFRQAMLKQKPIVVQFDQDLRAADLFRDVQWRGFGDPCRAAAICPLRPTSLKEDILGFVVIGLNPRRPYDEDYSQFISVASRLLSTSLTSVLLHEEDIRRREQTLANVEAMKFELKNQLLESQKEAERNVLKFQRFAERADIGIFIIGMNGVYSYRNDAWYSILEPEDHDIGLADAWEALIDDDYAQMGQAKFRALVETKQHQSFELRLKRTWNAPSQRFDDSVPEQQHMWVLCSIFPELTEDGEVLEIAGCITDISQQKWGETLQASQASRAQESKRQLENFIDTTSHEMRNPLSAIVQCADSIISSHNALKRTTDHQTTYRSISDTTVDAAETIVQCSKHMKSIVDDVLTISKLDSGLFVMTPVDVKLESIARNAVKMFEVEAKSAGVGLSFQLEESCKNMHVRNVSLDPTRVLQVLINLLTNAIKFTRLEETRRICVSLGISLEQPSHNADGRVSFIRMSDVSEAKTLQTDWEKGEIVYVIFSVQDTGRGLSDAEHALLFARFSQASPRTHIDYGGSGLGLFISRRLTEMHGGAIGFASKAGVGSTFSFYIKSRKSKPPPRLEKNGTSATIELSERTQVAALNDWCHDGKSVPLNLSATPIEDEVANCELHILIVEDNLVNQRVLAKQLQNLGMHVAVANHGGEAIEYLRSTNYCIANASTIAGTSITSQPLSLVLMDCEMPVMDGLTCVRHIRQLQREGVVHGHVPVIAVTANVRSEQVKVALDAGMDDVISKPFRIPELCACMRKTLRSTKGI